MTTPEEYAAWIKPGDAVKTPDGALWVVTWVSGDNFHLSSAYLDINGKVCRDLWGVTETVLPSRFLDKIADVREVD